MLIYILRMEENMNDTLKTIQHLRSIRKFTDKQLSEEDLEIILNSSIRAANSSSRQCYSIIVLKDPEKIQAICGYRSTTALVYCVDMNRIHDISSYMGEENAINAPRDFITASTDTIMAAQTAVISAKSIGIDSLITNGVHRQDFEKIYELLKLPKEYCFPLIAVLLGYSEEEEHLKGRMTKGVIHYDTYHHLTPIEIEEEIAAFDSKEKKYGLITYTNWEALGYSHYYNWFFQKWMGKQEDRLTPMLKFVEFFD